MAQPPWEAEFIKLWESGASQADMAAALGLPVGTVKSRCHRLQQQGKIPRREGGRSAVQSPVHAPVQETVQTSVQALVQSSVQNLVQTSVHELEERIAALEETVQSLVQSMAQIPVQVTVHDYAPPPLPRGKSTRWNMYILEPILAEITTLAKAREISPSRLAQELLWQALNARRSSTP